MGIENSAGNSSYQINAAVVEEMVLQHERHVGRGRTPTVR